MVRIQASEALASAAVLQVGTGSIDRQAARKMITQWQRASAAAGAPKPKPTQAEWMASLAAAGIEVSSE